MQNNNAHPDRTTPPSRHPEIDYTPKKYNLTESIQIMLKFFSITGIIFFYFGFSNVS